MFKKYAVIIGFAICPLYISVSLALYLFFEVLIHLRSAYAFVALWASVYGFLYFPPAFVLGCFYYLARIKKTILGVLCVSVCGAIGAQFWSFYALGENYGVPMSLGDFVFSIESYLGFVTSFISGVIFLPRAAKTEQADAD